MVDLEIREKFRSSSVARQRYGPRRNMNSSTYLELKTQRRNTEISPEIKHLPIMKASAVQDDFPKLIDLTRTTKDLCKQIKRS